MVTGLICSGIDVTEQVNAERELRASVNKNKAIIEALPDVLTVHDKKGTVLEIHVPDESYLVAPIAEIEGKNVKDLLPKELGDQLKNITQTVLRSQKMETLEVTAPVANGTVDYECRFVPFNKNQVLTIARNISKTMHLLK